MLSTFEVEDRLLVSGPNGGGLAMVSRQTVAVLSPESVTGVAVGPGQVAWCLQTGGPGRWMHLEAGIVYARVVDEMLAGEADLHDILIGADGIYLVATGPNAVLSTDRAHAEVVATFSPNPDSWHVNCVADFDGGLVASIFGRFEETRGYKAHSRGAGEVIRVRDGSTIVTGLSQPHSLVPEGESLWLCNSETFEVLRVSGGRIVERYSFPGYTRGLAITPRYMYVGLSCSRNESIDAVGRRLDTASIAVFCRDTKRIVGFVAVPWREIYDIRVLTDDVLAEDLLCAMVQRALPARASVDVDVPPGPGPTPMHEAFAELHERLDRHRHDLVSMFSDDIRRMQAVVASALEEAGAARQKLQDARGMEAVIERLAPLAQVGELRERIDQHNESLVSILSTDIQRMQSVATAAIEQAAAAQQQVEDLQAAQTCFADVRQLVSQTHALTRAVDRMPAELGEVQQDLARELRDGFAAVQEAVGRQEKMREELEAARARLADRDSALSEAHSEIRSLGIVREGQERDLARLRSEVRELQQQADQLELVKRSHSWRMTRPLRVARRLLGGQWSAADNAKLQHLLRRVIGRAPLLGEETRARLVDATLPVLPAHPGELPDAEMASMLRLAQPHPELADVFVWAVIDWRFRTQRPQHLARALAEKGHRVFYISNNFVDSAEPGFRIDPLDRDGRLFQIHLHLEHAPAIYFAMPDEGQVERIRGSLARLLAWSCSTRCISLVQHPYWTPLVRAVPNARVVYDCMDHHAGFLENAPEVLGAEQRLVTDSELVIVTSTWLEAEVGPQARATALVRNAGEFEFFRTPPAEVFRDDRGRRVIGYYGAIAEWFDASLVREVAQAFPDALVLLVGNDTGGVAAALADLANVRLTGEVPYAQLPYWLHGFDVCLLPFRVIPLTLATNPVKAYEYLSAGKPLVSVDLPEMRQFGDLVQIASDIESFIDEVGKALAAGHDPAEAARRQAFAAEQTWSHRATALDAALESIREPQVSVIVLTYNNLEFTEACLFSIEAYSDYANLEVIVVDNASSDGSREMLQRWVEQPSAAGHTRRLILNEDNLGFSAGNNVGLRAATGEYLVILNNDTYVTPGWVRTLCAHFRVQPELGLIGPVTNNIGNEARVEIHYADMADMIARAAEYTRAHPGRVFPLHNAAFFCVAMPRRVYERVGDMDEAFGIGFFEDDDYCRRVEQAGLRIACAEDVFIHHHLSASFDQLKGARKQELFERNKAIYEAKWGIWKPHRYRS